MSKKRDIHVVPHPDGWATRKENADRAGVVTDTQAEAIERAPAQARREHVEVVIHRPDGTIRDSDSYGRDYFRRAIRNTDRLSYRNVRPADS